MPTWIVYGYYFSGPFSSDDEDADMPYDFVLVSAETGQTAMESAQDIAGSHFQPTHFSEKPQN